MASTLSLVGAGGIGAPLILAIRTRYWSRAAVLITTGTSLIRYPAIAILTDFNFPRKEFIESKGIRITEQGLRPFLHEFEPDGDSFWAKGTWDVIDNGIDTDVYAYENGYISITPIQINRTHIILILINLRRSLHKLIR